MIFSVVASSNIFFQQRNSSKLFYVKSLYCRADFDWAAFLKWLVGGSLIPISLGSVKIRISIYADQKAWIDEERGQIVCHVYRFYFLPDKFQRNIILWTHFIIFSTMHWGCRQKYPQVLVRTIVRTSQKYVIILYIPVYIFDSPVNPPTNLKKKCILVHHLD